MQRMSGVYRDAFGRPISGASVTVYNAGTSTLATIYQASGSESAPAGQTNPFTTDATGAWGFAAQSGYYDIQISSTSAATEYYWNQYFTDAGTSTIANPMTTQGDMIGGGNGGAVGRVVGNATSTPMYVYGANSAFPVFKQIAATEISGLAAFVDANAVASFNGRIGAVVPTTGDYTVSQVTGAAPTASPTFTGTVSLGGATVTGLGASEVTFTQTGTGAVASTVDAELKAAAYNAVTDFGCDNTGATNTTTALLNFFNACIANKHSGYIPAGTYKVTTGVLHFDTPFVDAAWPNIYTSGYQATIFQVDSATATNAPVLQWTNGTATSAAGKYWRGGYFGGITINDTTGATAASRHGIQLRGIWGTKFGYMAGNGIPGNMVDIEPLLYTGNNPDPYAVTACYFEGIEANNGNGLAFKNENYVGFNLCTIHFLRAINQVGGGFYGCGAGNTIDEVSIASCQGWAIDDGGFVDHNGGQASRFHIGFAELDNVQNGIRLNSIYAASFDHLRFVHRFNVTPNVSSGYWPRTAVSFCGGTSPSVQQISGSFIHRIEAGGTKPDVGVFYDFSNNGNTVGARIDYYPIDNAGLGFVDTDFYTNTTNALFIISDRSRVTNWHRGVNYGTTSSPTNPAATSSTTSVMMGLAGSYTPQRSGQLLINVSGQMVNGIVNQTTSVQVRYGTGTAPANGAAVTGTGIGNSQSFTANPAGDSSGFSIPAYVTGLTIGTPIWIDAAVATTSTGSASIKGVTITVMENG